MQLSEGGVYLPRRKVDLAGPLYTGGGRGHLLRRKVDRGGPFCSEKGPGVTFAIFLTFRGGGGGIFNGEKLTGGGGGGPFSTG